MRGTPRALPRVPEVQLERFEVAVEAVESDVHPGVLVTGPVTFAPERPSEMAASWARQIQALRRD